MGSTNFGNQLISVQVLDPVVSSVVNRIADTVRRLGIYEGFYLTKINDSTVQVGIGQAEIQSGNAQVDGTRRQVGVNFQSVQNIAVSSVAPTIVLRYFFESTLNHFVDLLALASSTVEEDDIVLGEAIYAGSVLTGFNYATRSEVDTMDKFLKVEPLPSPAMKVIVRQGRVNYGVRNFDVLTQESLTFVAPSFFPRIDTLFVDVDGVVKVNTGVEALVPLAPGYQDRVVLAEVSLSVGQTQILVAHIKDVRNFISVGISFGGGISGQSLNFRMAVAGISGTTATVTAEQVSLKSSDNITLVVSNVNLSLNIDNPGANGLDVGVKANDTKYFVHVMFNPTANVIAGILSLSATSPTLPANFIYSEVFSMVRTNSSGQLLGARQFGRYYYWKTWVEIASGTPGNVWTAINVSSYHPSAISEISVGTTTVAGTGNRIGITNDNTVAIPNFSSDFFGGQLGSSKDASAGYESKWWEFEILTADMLFWRCSGQPGKIFLTGFIVTK